MMKNSLAYGTISLYGQFLARLYAIVIVVLISMDASGMREDIKKNVKKLAYDVIKSIAFAKFSKLSKFEKIIDKMLDPGWPTNE